MIMDRQSSEFNDSNRSLRRSFVAIHGKTSPTIDDADGRRCRKDSSSSLPKSNRNNNSFHQHKKSRGSNNRAGNRRTSMDTTSPSPLCPPQHNHSRKPQQQTPQQTTLRRRSTYTGMTADEAQKRVAELLNDKLTIQQKEQQQQQQEPTRRPHSSSNHHLKHEHSLHTSMPNIHQQTQQQQTRQLGYRPDYKLGQTVRSTSHIKIPTSSQNAMQQVSTLMKYDFAFIKRSNGLYSYAILAYRSNDNKGESLTFVMDDKGCTKMIRKKYWCEYIRLVNTDDLELEQQEERLSKEGLLYPPPSYKRRVSDPHQMTQDMHHQFSTYKKEDIDMLCQEIPIVCQEVPKDDAVDEYYTQEEDDDETAPLPEMIAFKPTNGNEECSLISSVSDRARRAHSAARVWRSGGGD